jgi:hypothetical protein
MRQEIPMTFPIISVDHIREISLAEKRVLMQPMPQQDGEVAKQFRVLGLPVLESGVQGRSSA